MAIDDVEISGRPCEQLATCNFENGLCSYINLDGDDFDWRRQPGSLVTPYNGPANDHTFGLSNGHYAFADTSFPRLDGNLAWLMTDADLDVGASYCFSIWYYLVAAEDEAMSTLSLYQRKNEAAKGTAWVSLGYWNNTSSRNQWIHELVDITPPWPHAQLVR